LPVGQEILRRHFAFDVAVLGVLHQADDLDVELGTAAGAHAPADRVAAEVELAGELLVDDRHFRSSENVRSGELAARQHRDPEGAEIVGTNQVVA